MSRLFFAIGLILLASLSHAQELYVQSNAEVTLTDGAIISTGGQLVNEGRFDIQANTETIVSGLGDNTGFFINDGLLNLFNDWSNAGVFNTQLGEMRFSGANNQDVSDTYLPLRSLSLNKVGTVTITADSVKVTENLEFTNGILSVDPNTEFIVEEDADIIHDAGMDAYFNGEIISRGTRLRSFPVGDDGYFGKITFLEVQGINPEVGVSLINNPGGDPIPGSDLVGVSGSNAWRLNYRSGFLDSILVQIEFLNEDLQNFPNRNDIAAEFNQPVLASADNDPLGPYSSLGVESLIDTDSLSFGTLIAGEAASFTDFGSKYLAIAVGPKINPEGEVYFPNVFSPFASDIRNQTYKVFGERILDQPFRIEIYDRFNTLMYEANSFNEVSTAGWDGLTPNGNEAPGGIYYIFVTYSFVNTPEEVRNYQGSILLQR